MILEAVGVLLGLLVIKIILLPLIRFKTIAGSMPQGVWISRFFPVVGELYLAFLTRKKTNMHCQFMTQYMQNVDKHSRALLTNVGTDSLLLIYDTSLVKQFFNNQSLFCEKDQGVNVVVREALGLGLIFSEGAAHKQKRRIFAEIFNFQNLTRHAPQVKNAMQNRVRGLPQGQYFSLLQKVIEVTSSVIVQTFLGFQKLGVEVQGKNLVTVANQLFGECSKQFLSVYFMLTGKPTNKFRRQIAVVKQQLLQITRGRVKEFREVRAKGVQYKRDILNLFLEKNEGKSDEELALQAKEQFHNFLIAGTDTTAHLVAMSIYYLSQHRDIAELIREETRQFRQTEGPPNIKMGSDLLYLNAFINEVSRIYGPVNSLIPRRVTQDTMLGDVPLAKGMLVNVPLDILHLSSKHFPDPLEFNIKRWIDKPVPDDVFSFVPFAAGNRNCIGQHLAMFQARTFLMSFLETWDFEVEQPFSTAMDYFSFPYFIQPFRIRLSPRAKM